MVTGPHDTNADTDVFRTLYDEHQPSIHRYLTRRVGVDAAEDLTAAVFLIAWSNPKLAAVEAGREGGWLMGVAKNVLRRHHRRAGRESRAFTALPVEVDVEDHEAELVQRLDTEAAAAKLRSELSDVDAHLIAVYLRHDRRYAAMAEELAVAEGTAKSRMSRLRRRIRQRGEADRS